MSNTSLLNWRSSSACVWALGPTIGLGISGASHRQNGTDFFAVNLLKWGSRYEIKMTDLQIYANTDMRVGHNTKGKSRLSMVLKQRHKPHICSCIGAARHRQGPAFSQDRSPCPHTWTLENADNPSPQNGTAYNGRQPPLFMKLHGLWGMEGWVSLVGWPIADRSEKVLRPETDVITTEPRRQPVYIIFKSTVSHKIMTKQM